MISTPFWLVLNLDGKRNLKFWVLGDDPDGNSLENILAVVKITPGKIIPLGPSYEEKLWYLTKCAYTFCTYFKFKEIVTTNRVVAFERDGEYTWT